MTNHLRTRPFRALRVLTCAAALLARMVVPVAAHAATTDSPRTFTCTGSLGEPFTQRTAEFTKNAIFATTCSICGTSMKDGKKATQSENTARIFERRSDGKWRTKVHMNNSHSG